MNTASSPTLLKTRVIVMPVSHTASSERAIDWFAENVHKENDLLMFVHVAEPYSGLVLPGSVGKPPAIAEDCCKSLTSTTNEGRNLGNFFLERARLHNIRSKFYLHMGNKPGEHVVRLARQHSADLIVLGSKGTTSFKKTILGSLSDYVFHHTNIPCLIVPAAKKRTVSMLMTHSFSDATPLDFSDKNAQEIFEEEQEMK